MSAEPPDPVSGLLKSLSVKFRFCSSGSQEIKENTC